ncbi:acireductone dioxygenase [Cyanobium gracile]|uniref:Acireductone dioxygenase n=1 Tax=Cyanobium gracile UHCC 0281 TaxID=3110309 RepID=A0ABU5SX05_9CYAN|nr:acireductone dioxygenase [Cyanobium gracile]MEA5442892.1 acireductone dioxygenase [Cyanobium gracile UHCC 0281]
MTHLVIRSASGGSHEAPLVQSGDGDRIASELAARGVRFERWATPVALAADADQTAILSAYATEIARVQADGGYRTVDAIRLGPDHPDRAALRAKFLSEHTHAEDEVRFFVEGRGLFCLHIADEVLQVVCEQGDWIGVPAGTRHWFDTGARPSFCALRFFDNSDGWVASFTGDPIATRFPLLEEVMAAA